MFKLVQNEDGDWVIKYRSNGKTIFISAESINLTPWELYYQYINNRQEVLNLANEYLITSGLVEE